VESNRARLPAPPEGMARVNVLTFGGLHFGQDDYGELTTHPMVALPSMPPIWVDARAHGEAQGHCQNRVRMPVSDEQPSGECLPGPTVN
jgi:hypothetical protein